MSLVVRERSLAYRLRDDGTVVDEQFGGLHRSGSLLEWGSITKTVTATIAQRLVDAGQLSMSAPVAEYLPVSALPVRVDVAALVGHTSGLPRVPADMLSQPSDLRDPYARYTNEHFDEKVLPDLARQHTGTVGEYSYSNLGYALLTRLLEKATGRTWWDLAHGLVLTPYDVTDVTIEPDPERVPVLHTWTGKARRQWTGTGPFLGAGGLVGTFDALEQYACATSRDVKSRPLLGWRDSGGLVWHNGHNRDHGAFVGFAGTRVITVHTLGHRTGTSDRTATRLIRKHPGR